MLEPSVRIQSKAWSQSVLEVLNAVPPFATLTGTLAAAIHPEWDNEYPLVAFAGMKIGIAIKATINTENMTLTSLLDS